MKFQVLATDYDGTIARHCDGGESTGQALSQWKEAGRKLVMVTGRELLELLRICPFTKLFDQVVAENGALLYVPSTENIKILAPSPPQIFLDCLRTRGVKPLAIGRGIVATQEVFKTVVTEAIHELGLTLQVSTNKVAVMLLPKGAYNATSLLASLKESKRRRSETVRVW